MAFVNKIDGDEDAFTMGPLTFTDTSGDVVTVRMPPVPLDLTLARGG